MPSIIHNPSLGRNILTVYWSGVSWCILNNVYNYGNLLPFNHVSEREALGVQVKDFHHENSNCLIPSFLGI